MPLTVGLALLICTLALKIIPNSISDSLNLSLDNYIYDTSLKLNLATTKKLPEGLSSIAVVDIDEVSIKKIGHWPWSRDKLALLTESIRSQGGIVIAFDILFTESPNNPVDEVIKKAREKKAVHESVLPEIQKLWADFDYDENLRKAFKPEDTILGFLLNDILETDSVGYLPKPLEVVEDLEGTSIFHLSRYVGNLSSLQQTAQNGGFISSIPDKDGIIRSAPLVLGHENNVYPSLALEASRLLLLMDRDSVRVKWGEIQGERVIDGVYLGQQFISTDESGRILIPFRGADSQIRHFSAVDVMNKQIPQDVLQNAIVFVGSTAFGLSDFHATPVNPVFPGVDIHGYISQGILTGQLISAPSYGFAIEFLLILLMGILLAMLLPFLEAVWMVLCFALSVLSVLLVYAMLFRFHSTLISVSLPLVMGVGQISFNLVYGMLFEFRRRSQLKGLFGQYVPQEIVEIMSEHPELYTMDGTSSKLTVLFADVVHFTSVSEKLTPQQIRQLLNRYFTPMTKIILDSDGTIDKYVGDMIMAFWGAPVSDENHAKHALGAALKMLKETGELGLELEKDGLPPIKMGIGLNTGIMSVGDMGSEYRRAYTVLGDAVNTGSRVEGLTRFYGVDIAVGEETRKGQDDFVFRILDRVRVKGKDKTIEIFELVSTREEAPPELLEQVDLHNKAMQLYFEQKFSDAKDIMQKLLDNGGNPILYQLFLERIKIFETNPPEKDWDGSTKWSEK